MQNAIAIPTTGERSDDSRRALIQAATVPRLASSNCRSCWSSREKACTTSIDCRPSCRVESISDWRLRTSLTAVLIALFTRTTKMASSGVTARAIRAKSQRSQNITVTIATIVRLSVNMLRVDTDAKL